MWRFLEIKKTIFFYTSTFGNNKVLQYLYIYMNLILATSFFAISMHIWYAKFTIMSKTYFCSWQTNALDFIVYLSFTIVYNLHQYFTSVVYFIFQNNTVIYFVSNSFMNKMTSKLGLSSVNLFFLLSTTADDVNLFFTSEIYLPKL